MKPLGILGGMGPEASARLYTLITRATPARTDQEHIDIYLHSLPSIPDRTSFLTGQSPVSPLSALKAGLKGLQDMGAQVLAIPCVTSHSFYGELTAELGVPLLHMIRETANRLRAQGVIRAGLLATDGTVRRGLFDGPLAEAGIGLVLPGEAGQTAVMRMIYGQIKAGQAPDLTEFSAVCEDLRRRGAERIILGCTELSLIPAAADVFCDPLEILARCAVDACVN